MSRAKVFSGLLSVTIISVFFSGCVISPKEVKYIYVAAPGTPVVSILSPANGSVIHTNVAAINGTASVDSPNTIANVQVKVNNGSYTAATGTTNWSVGPGAVFTNGYNTVTVIAISDTNKTNSPFTIGFNYDASTASTNGDTYTPGAGWNVYWSDEFNGNSLDTSVWNMEVRNDGCGNNELEYYTDRPNNVWVGGGTLVIKAIKENYINRNYTSGRLTTQNKKTWQYGKFAARIMIPTGQGLWPAYWLLGDNIGTAGWPGCGELDIMENKGSQPTISSGAIHFGPPWPNNMCFSSTYTLPSGNLYSSFHIFELIWTSTNVKWYVDGALFKTVNKSDITGTGQPWVFDHPFFYIINLAIGGTFDGNPGAGTIFPKYMFVDWVRVYSN